MPAMDLHLMMDDGGWKILLFVLAAITALILLGFRKFLPQNSIIRPTIWALLFSIICLLFLCNVRIPIDDVTKFLGYPIPFVIFELREGRWVDFIGTPLWLLLDMFMAFVIALLLYFATSLYSKRIAAKKL